MVCLRVIIPPCRLACKHAYKLVCTCTLAIGSVILKFYRQLSNSLLRKGLMFGWVCAVRASVRGLDAAYFSTQMRTHALPCQAKARHGKRGIAWFGLACVVKLEAIFSKLLGKCCF